MIWLKFALRNIYKNRRRSMATILAVAIGFCAISLFHGYTQKTYTGVAEAIIQDVGHLTIFRRGFNEHGKLAPEKYILEAAELRRIEELLTALPHVVLTTPRLSVSGLVSNGKTSTIFLAQGVVPADDIRLRGELAPGSSSLDDGNPSAVQVASGLASMLKLERGDSAVIMGTTLAGMVNALDIEVLSTYNTGVDATNDKFMKMTLRHAKQLYDTEGADRLVVLLDDTTQTPLVRAAIETMVQAHGLDIEILSWDELSSFYGQLRGMFDMIFLFIFLIVIVVAVMSVINTMSMTVVERVREIGTLRSIGVRKAGVKRLFSVEGGLLGFIGCAVGICLTLLVYLLMEYMQFTFTPPSSTAEIALQVQIDVGFMLSLAGSLILLALLSAYFPARRAAMLPIVDALGHV